MASSCFHLFVCLLSLIVVCRSFVIEKQVRYHPTALASTTEARATSIIVSKQEETHAVELSLAEHINIPKSKLPPPPESTGNPDDDGFRSFRDQVPESIQSWLRDSGVLRFVVDSLVLVGLPSLVKQYPDAVPTFLKLSSQCKTVSYGDHPRQKMDVFTPENGESKGLVVVCHGGAWGSGEKWMYRLTATKKLECGYTVAVLGYRTYPDANVDGQVEDICDAIQKLQEMYPSQHTTILGHSSGAHVSLLGAIQQKINVDALICVAGVYEIVNHYNYEKGRGVEMISPLKPANGHVEDEWTLRSPMRLVKEMESIELPPTLLIHGVEDSVVPYTSALDFFGALEGCEANENCTLSILPSTEHAETVIELMVGGKTQDVVLDWLERQVKEA